MELFLYWMASLGCRRRRTPFGPSRVRFIIKYLFFKIKIFFLGKYNIPTIIFINKLDRVGADLGRASRSVAEKLKSIPLQTQFTLQNRTSLEAVRLCRLYKEYFWCTPSSLLDKVKRMTLEFVFYNR
jgi:hypothetical protein